MSIFQFSNSQPLEPLCVSSHSLPPTTALDQLKVCFLCENSLYFHTPDLPRPLKLYTEALTSLKQTVFHSSRATDRIYSLQPNSDAESQNSKNIQNQKITQLEGKIKLQHATEQISMQFN